MCKSACAKLRADSRLAEADCLHWWDGDVRISPLAHVPSAKRDLSAQREAARLPGIDDFDSNSSGRAGRRQMDHDEGSQDHDPTIQQRRTRRRRPAQLYPTRLPATAGLRRYIYTNTFVYLQIHADTCHNIIIHTDTCRYTHILLHTYKVQSWIAFHSVTNHALPVSAQQYLP